MLCPSHPPWLDHSNYAWRRVQAMKLWTNTDFRYFRTQMKKKRNRGFRTVEVPKMLVARWSCSW
jgi:hypothetical protein